MVFQLVQHNINMETMTCARVYSLERDSQHESYAREIYGSSTIVVIYFFGSILYSPFLCDVPLFLRLLLSNCSIKDCLVGCMDPCLT
jgi:hypothetical protein